MSGGQDRGKIKKKREKKGRVWEERDGKCFWALSGHTHWQICLNQNEERMDTELSWEDIFSSLPTNTLYFKITRDVNQTSGDPSKKYYNY